jgi:hypothetical protein
MEQLQSLTITIPGKLPTWNQLLAMNRWRRADVRHLIHQLVFESIRTASVWQTSTASAPKPFSTGLVLAKVIANDTTKEVKEVLFSQTKVKNKDEEKVIVTVVRV